jgi:hypothetical protein
MSHLAKLEFKSVTRAATQDPVQQRRAKLLSAIEEQLKVAEAAVAGRSHQVTRKASVKNEQGERVLVERTGKARAWFFQQDGGWYVQCKYGNKALTLGKGNAVFVPSLAEVSAVLAALKAATEAGELDAAMGTAALKKKPK